MGKEFIAKYMGEGPGAAKMQWRTWLQPLAGTYMQTEAS